MLNRESKKLEYKEEITNSFLKTVSAFANYGGGTIVFGITDDRLIKGLNEIQKSCITIENMINDTISPHPDYLISPNNDNTISLIITDGLNKPYLYKNKAYKRNDSSTIEVDRLEFNRLVMEGLNETFEGQISKTQSLSFNTLEKELIEKLGIHKLSDDILKTLQLLTLDSKYNNAAELLSDTNSFKGVDITKFGKNISEIRERISLDYISIIEQFHSAINSYRRYYQVEEINGSTRTLVQLIPETAFREVLANALIHRSWDIDVNIRISMFDDKIEITSPGGLPVGISIEEYLSDQFSLLRNPILGNIFFRLNYIEKFGTGIRRINEAYSKNYNKPIFRVFDNSLSVTLPVFNINNLNESENIILDTLKNRRLLTRAQIEEITGFKKNKVIKILNSLYNMNIVETVGNGKSLKYQIK